MEWIFIALQMYPCTAQKMCNLAKLRFKCFSFMHPCMKNANPNPFHFPLVLLTCALASSESTWCMTESISRWSIMVSVKWSGTNSPMLLSHLTRATDMLGSLCQKSDISMSENWATWRFSNLSNNLEVKEMTTSSSSSSLKPPESVRFTPSLVGLIIVCVLIQECKLDIPSRIPWASSPPCWLPWEDKSVMIAFWNDGNLQIGLVAIHFSAQRWDNEHEQGVNVVSSENMLCKF